MTAAEYDTITRGLGLNAEALCRLFAIADRTERRWRKGQLPVPGPVAAEIRHIDGDFTRAVDAVVERTRQQLDELGPPAEPPILIRYRTDEELAHYRPDLARLGTAAHGALVDRLRRALEPLTGPCKIHWLDPEPYEAWRAATRAEDSDATRVLWATLQG